MDIRYKESGMKMLAPEHRTGTGQGCTLTGLTYSQQKHMTLHPHFEVYIEGRLAAVIKTESVLPRQTYTVEICDWTDDWTVAGNFWADRFVITSPNAEIATITHPPFSLGPCHLMDICQSENELLVLCTVLVIQFCTYKGA